MDGRTRCLFGYLLCLFGIFSRGDGMGAIYVVKLEGGRLGGVWSGTQWGLDLFFNVLGGKSIADGVDLSTVGGTVVCEGDGAWYARAFVRDNLFVVVGYGSCWLGLCQVFVCSVLDCLLVRVWVIGLVENVIGLRCEGR